MLVAWTLGPITFGAPAALWGAAAVAGPILVHLLLRTRPQRQPFPAMRFLLETHLAAEKSHRLRRFLLLVLRILAVALVAFLLAEPRLRAARWLPVGAGPVSVAVCIDNSASMSYRFENKTRLQAAKDWAASLVNDRSRFGEGSEFAVLCNQPATPDRPAQAVALGTRQAAEMAIESLADSGHDQPVGHLIRRADGLLRNARNPARAIYVFTDSTARAWRDLAEPLLTPASGAAVYCIDVGVDENRNTTLTLSSPPKRPITANVPLRLDLSASAGPNCLPVAAPVIDVSIDGTPKRREPLPPLAPGQTVGASIVLPGLAEGLHRIRVELSPSDALAHDNVRFAGVQVGALPVVAVVGAPPTSASPAVEEADADIVATMLAPPTLEPGRQRFRVVRMAPGDVEAADFKMFRCVFLADVRDLTETAWRKLADYTRNGGTVTVLLGESVAPAGYAAAAPLLPALPLEIVRFEEPAYLQTPDVAHPLLKPFARTDVDSPSDRAVLRAWKVGPLAAGASVLCPLTSGMPGLLERAVGTGQCRLLTFSPRGDWSEFAARAAPMIVLLHTIAETGSPAADRVVYTQVGAGLTFKPDADNRATWSACLYALDRDARPQLYELGREATSLPLPTGSPGLLVVFPAGDSADPSCLAAVNVADEESDLSRLAAAEVTGRFAPGVASAARTLDELNRLQRRQQVGLDLVFPVGAILLALLVLESYFANRFYTKPAARPSPPARPKPRK